jgi:hypothetical protein
LSVAEMNALLGRWRSRRTAGSAIMAADLGEAGTRRHREAVRPPLKLEFGLARKFFRATQAFDLAGNYRAAMTCG